MNRSELIKKTIVIIEMIICLFAFVMIFTVDKNADTEDLTTVKDTEIVPSQNNIKDKNVEIKEASEIKPVEDKKEIYKAFVQSEDWRLILVNKQHKIPNDYEVKLVNILGNRQVDERIADDTTAMFEKAKEDGVSLTLVSAYRSEDRQTSLFNSKVRTNMQNKMSYFDAYSEASNSVTPPGTSEHQLGLALDIVGSGHYGLTEKFADTKAGIWLKENCAEFGFILRYPEGKEHITGIIYEPWHFRYVGKEYATEIMKQGITLEEYLLYE